MTVALLRQRPRYNVAAFIELIRPYPDHQRWELLDGEPVLMAPQSERHQTVVANLMRILDSKARERGCRTTPGLGLLNEQVDDYAPIPDVVVRCGPPVDGGYVTDPVLVAEVLSPSTENNDRGRKLEFYTAIESLRTILIIYQDEVRIEAWERGGNGWVRSVYGDRSAELPLGEFGSALVRELYEDVLLP
jgi:Uma2 family endonuclease